MDKYPSFKKEDRMVQHNGQGAIDRSSDFFPEMFVCFLFVAFRVLFKMKWINELGVKVSSVEALFLVARNTMDPFKKLMREFVQKAGLDPDAVVSHKGKPLMMDEKSPWRVLSVAPLKGQERCREKVANEYDGDWSLLVDVVRCSIVVQTEDALESVAQAMMASNDPRYSYLLLFAV